MTKIRRISDKYAQGSYATSIILHKISKNISILLMWIEANVGGTEVIEISSWNDDKLYITILDTRKDCWPKDSHEVGQMRFSVYVDFQRDYVGRMYVRSDRWKRALKKKMGEQVYKEQVSIYTTINPVKQVKSR